MLPVDWLHRHRPHKVPVKQRSGLSFCLSGEDKGQFLPRVLLRPRTIGPRTFTRPSGLPAESKEQQNEEKGTPQLGQLAAAQRTLYMSDPNCKTTRA